MSEYHQYTIYSKHGRLFRSDTHYIFLGGWLPYSDDIVILKHGKLTGSEYHQFISQEKINLFEDVVSKTVDIFSKMTMGYETKLNKNGKSIKDYICYIGCLDRDKYNKYLWKGQVHRH